MSARYWVMLPPSRSAAATVAVATAAEDRGLEAISNSICLQPPPVAGDQRRAYETRIAETFYQ